MKKTVLFSSLSIVLIALIIGRHNVKSNTIAQSSPRTTEKTYTLAEVASHNSASNCWMAISQNVYNVSSYTRIHPGGQRILEGCGTDATTLFNSIGQHVGARAILNTFKIGRLV